MATGEAEKASTIRPSYWKICPQSQAYRFQIMGTGTGIISSGVKENAPSSEASETDWRIPFRCIEMINCVKKWARPIQITRSVDYYSAGDVNSSFDADKNFYFMEMNTRIQVEHTVTEMVPGVDLIELQIKVAEGQKLPLKQEDVKLKGWQLECRINAEDPQANFHQTWVS